MPDPDYHLHVSDSDSLAMSDIFILLHLSKLLDPLASLKCSTSPAFCCSEDISLSGKRKESWSGKRKECWNSIETDLIAMPSARYYASSVNKQLGPKNVISTQLCSVVTLLQLLSHTVCKVQVSCAVRPGVVYATHCFGRTAHARAAPGSADHLLPPTESRSLFPLFFFSIRDRPSHPLIGVARLAALGLCDLDRMWNPG